MNIDIYIHRGHRLDPVTCICIYVFIYIYTYVCATGHRLDFSSCLYVHMCIHVHTCIQVTGHRLDPVTVLDTSTNEIVWDAQQHTSYDFPWARECLSIFSSASAAIQVCSFSTLQHAAAPHCKTVRHSCLLLPPF